MICWENLNVNALVECSDDRYIFTTVCGQLSGRLGHRQNY